MIGWGWGEEIVPPRPDARGWLRVALRAPVILIVLGLGLGCLLALRLIERPLFGLRRPVTPVITSLVCRTLLRLMAIRWERRGAPLHGAEVVVANHSSWLDILALNAGARIYFVSKDEVAGWPGIGLLARAVGTVFIRRDPRGAAEQVAILRDRLAAGHALALFPEGTTSDGRRVLPFKPTLFAAFLAEGTRIQPVSVDWHAPEGRDPRFYGWWGEMALGPHLLSVLAEGRGGRVRVTWHPPIVVPAGADRKALAAAAQAAVASAVSPAAR